MADDIVLNSGSGGDTVAADDIGGVKYQRVKVTFGGDGSATDVESGAPLPVTIISSALPAGAATAANQSTAIGHLATIAGAVGGTEMQVDIVSSALPTGAATEATLATVAGDTTSIDGKTPALGQAAKAASVPVTLASDEDNVNVDVVSSALPTGAATAANQSTEIGHLATIAGAVTGSEMQVDVITLPAIPAGTNNIGDVDIVGGTIADDAADSGNPVKVGARVETSIAGNTPLSDGDRADMLADADRALLVRRDAPLADSVDGSASATDTSSTACIAAGGAGVKHYLTDITLVNTSATDIRVTILSGATVRWEFPVPANGGVTHAFARPLAPNAAAEAWNFQASAGVTTLYCSMNGFATQV